MQNKTREGMMGWRYKLESIRKPDPMFVCTVASGTLVITHKNPTPQREVIQSSETKSGTASTKKDRTQIRLNVFPVQGYFSPIFQIIKICPGKYTFSLSNKTISQALVQQESGGKRLRWNRVRGAPGSGNNWALFSPQGLKSWGNQNPDTERTIERESNGSWVPEWGAQQDHWDSTARWSSSSASVASPKRWLVSKESRRAWEPTAEVRFSQPSRAQSKQGKFGE